MSAFAVNTFLLENAPNPIKDIQPSLSLPPPLDDLPGKDGMDMEEI